MSTTTLPAATVRRVVEGVLKGERRFAAVSVTFLGPKRMTDLNREHLGHDHPTDVISFALTGPDDALVGDIYICGAVAAKQAKALKVPVREELIRLVVHGTLHVLGHDHPAGERRLGAPMWKLQEKYVRRLA
jgi:probable rRNA maturation factor